MELPTELDFEDWGATFVVYQEEIGESGNHHLQGYIEMPKPCRPTKFDCLRGAHFEKARGTPQENLDYCTKDDSRMPSGERVIWGNMSRGQGQRNDLLALRDAVRSGKRDRDLFDDDVVAGSAIKFQRGVAAMREAYSEPTERGDIRVTLHYGPPGTGKTYCCDSDDGMF